MSGQPLQTAPIGIVAAGVYVPETFLSAAEISERTGIPEQVIRDKFGITRKPVPGPDDHTGAMGLWAASDAVQRAGIDPREIDVVLCTTEEWKEYPLWTAGIKLAHDLGATRAWAIDVQQRCGTTIAAIKLACGLMRSDPDIQTVLIAGGYRNCDFVDFKNSRSRFLTNLSAGGGALLLRRGHPVNHVLATSVLTDGAFSLDVIVPVGGTVSPLTPASLVAGEMRLDVPDPADMKRRLDPVSMANFLTVVDRALAAAGKQRSDISFVNLLHMKRSAHNYVLQQLGVPPERSLYLHEYGHLGQQDQPLVIRLACDRGLLRPGDLMVMIAAGIGYTWTASVVSWGG